MLAVIAGLAFVGFEQAPVLGEEARNPRRTIPAATYTALAAIAALYAAAAWAMDAHAGRAHVAAAAAAQGPGLLYGLSSSGALAQAAQWLFITSLFAAALAIHNVTWRYMFALSPRGRPARRASAAPAVPASPAPPPSLQSGSALAVIVLFAAARWPAMNGLFFGGGTMGGLGVMILLAVTSAAVIRFFGPHPRRREPLGADDRPGPVRPAAGAAIVLAIMHFGTLLGTGPGNPAAWLLPSAFGAAAVGGLCWGAFLRARRPDVYATIGLGAHAAGQATARQREDAAMTAHARQAGSADHVIVRAGPADIGVLSQVIADAFFSLTLCRWLIPDGPARRADLPRLFPALRRARDRRRAGRDHPRPGRRRAVDPRGAGRRATRRLRRAAGRHHRPVPQQFPGLR